MPAIHSDFNSSKIIFEPLLVQEGTQYVSTKLFISHCERQFLKLQIDKTMIDDTIYKMKQFLTQHNFVFLTIDKIRRWEDMFISRFNDLSVF